MCRWILTVAVLAALVQPILASAQDTVRPLDRIYGPPAGAAAIAGPRQPGKAQPPGPLMGSPATRGMTPGRTAAPGTRPLDSLYGPAAGASAKAGAPGSGSGAGVGGGATVGRPQSGTSPGATTTRQAIGAARKPAAPTYRGGIVGTRPRMSNSPSLSRPRR